MTIQLTTPARIGTQAVSAPPAARKTLINVKPAATHNGKSSTAEKNFQVFGLLGTHKNKHESTKFARFDWHISDAQLTSAYDT